MQVSLHLTTGRTHSCYHPPTHEIPLSEIKENPSALHNTIYKKEQRKKMLMGVRPTECQYCWNIEDSPGSHLSDRHYRSAETWSEPFFDETLKAGELENINPRAVEVNFNHACQLKCSYCSPHLSSTWMEEVLEHGGYKLATGGHNDLSYFKSQNLIPIKQSEKNPYAEAFWKWWPELYKELLVFRMTGGEPLMDVNTYRVLDYILENPKPDLLLAITSNLSIQPEFFNKFISRISKISNGRFIKKFQLYVSCDSEGKQAEYIRNGLVFDRFEKYLDKFLEEVPSATVTFIITYNNLSIVGFDRLMEKILSLRARFSRYQQRIFFDTPLLRGPPWMSIQILPPEYFQIVEESIARMKSKQASFESIESRFHRFLDYEITRLERNLAWMKQGQPADELKKQRANFYLYFTEHDRRRNTQFLQAFPEMIDFWNLCKKDSSEYN